MVSKCAEIGLDGSGIKMHLLNHRPNNQSHRHLLPLYLVDFQEEQYIWVYKKRSSEKEEIKGFAKPKIPYHICNLGRLLLLTSADRYDHDHLSRKFHE